jgi:hypothetical protein
MGVDVYLNSVGPSVTRSFSAVLYTTERKSFYRVN